MKLKLNKISIIFLIASVLAFSLIVTISATSCFANTGSTSNAEEGNINDKENEQDSESAAEVEEEIVEEVKGEDLTDYDNAKVGAKIKGAIPGFLCTNKDNIITLEITNTSDFIWRTDSRYQVKVGYHYYGQDVDASDYDGTSRSVFDKDVEPGETAKIDVIINDITKPGNYIIQIDLVLEGKYWFSAKGAEMLESPVFFSECSE